MKEKYKEDLKKLQESTISDLKPAVNGVVDKFFDFIKNIVKDLIDEFPKKKGKE
jgi:hypothetical protein